MTKKILSSFDVATISEVLNHELGLVPNSVSIIETGWDHLVAEVNKEWIFRFPRALGSIENLEREKKLLDYLRNHLSLPIPKFHYVGTDTAFIGYKKIPGIHLNTKIYRGLDPRVQKQIAETLASFFTKLHQAVSIEQALEWGYRPIIRPLIEIEDLAGSLPSEISAMVKKAVDFARRDFALDHRVFCHQDVNGDNMAFDEISGQIAGIFDFSDTGLGHYSLDFAELFVIDDRLARSTAQFYAQMNDVPNPLIGGASDYVLRKATWLVLGRTMTIPQSEKELLLGLRDFIPIWRDVLSTTI